MKQGYDIDSKLRNDEISVGLYHTAGKGTRLAPLPAAENNNKPGVKLPATHKVKGINEIITILEAVIKQTGCYAKSRIGRLSVFWGDQVFIPTVPVEYNATYHIDILCSLGPMLSEVEWKEKGMDKYGLIAQSKNGSAAQVEKVSHSTAVKLLSTLGDIESVGASLGSFSLSAVMLMTLLAEFSVELERKQGKLDSDPHFWMPMTLSKEAYAEIMAQKGVTEENANTHYSRIAQMIEKFNQNPDSKSHMGLFGPVDVGQNVYWWDYGQLKLYVHNSLLMAETSIDAQLMRQFFGLGENLIVDSEINSSKIDSQSCLSNCSIGDGFVKKSVLCNVHADYIEATDCVLVNVTAKRIVASPGSVLYNIVSEDPNGIVVNDGAVNACIINEEANMTLIKSHVSIDGGKYWDEKVENNNNSFGELYEMNTIICPMKAEHALKRSHSSSRSSSRSTTGEESETNTSK